MFLLQNLWFPSKDYKFPILVDKRRFIHNWFDIHNWLSYSVVSGKEGAFCHFCVLMGKNTGGRGSQNLRKLVKEPFVNYKKAREVFPDHQNHEYHKLAVEKVTNLLSNSMPIDERLSSQIRENRELMRLKEQEYRKRAREIVETVKILGEQEMPFRGHRDHGPLDLDTPPGPENEGNVRALLRYRALGDTQLYQNIQNSPKNASLTSWVIQNEIIQVCGEVIKESLVREIKNAGIYSLIADCTTDISKKEQLAFAIRYVTDEGDMRENIVGVLTPTATTGAALAGDLQNALTNLGLSLSNCRGQAYDGCGNMSGHIKVVQTFIKQKNPLAFYTHCHSHKLNLALGNALDVPGIKQMLATLSQVSNFISGSAGRVQLLEKNVEKCFPESKLKKIKPLCVVRWVEQHDSCITFRKLLSQY